MAFHDSLDTPPDVPDGDDLPSRPFGAAPLGDAPFPDDPFADERDPDAPDVLASDAGGPAVVPLNGEVGVEDDGRYSPVRLDRRVVLAGLLIAAAAVLLLLVVSSGGEPDGSDPDAPRPTAATPEFIERGEGTPAYGDALPADPAAQPAYVDPYGAGYADPYAADPYAGSVSSDYATTRSVPAAYGEPSYGTSSAGGAPAARSAASGRGERDPLASSFERAVASPLVAGSGSARGAQGPARPALPEGLSPEAEQEIYELQAIAAALTPPGVPGGTAEEDSDDVPSRSEAPLLVQDTRQATPGAPGAQTREAFRARTSMLGPTAYGVRAESPGSGLVLSAGTVVPAALMTGIHSDLPGAVVAQVTRNVYDSRTQRDVLIPAGSRLVGEYDDQVAYGQDRALVAWTRLIFPDGRSVSLPGLPAHDLRGQSGLRDQVNRHTARLFGSAVLLAAVGAGVDLAAPDGTGGVFGSQSPQETAARQVAIELSRVATEVVRRGLDVQPTVTVRPGFRFYVFLARDLAFAAPYRERPDVARFPRPQVRQRAR